MPKPVLPASVLAFALTARLAHADPAAITGLWATPDGNARIEISDCGDASPCGYLVWVNPQEASSDRDINNPDESLRERPLAGMLMVWDFRARGESWHSGKVYDPESGRTYRASLTPKDDGRLALRGCFGPFCRSQVWTRATPPDAAATTSAPAR